MSGNIKTLDKLNKYSSIALDSNIFIYFFENHPSFFKKTKSIFMKLAENSLAATTSIITLTEILSFPLSLAAVEKTVENFYITPNLKIIEVDQAVALEAARIRREYKFRLPDSIQLSTALKSGVKAFITNDERLKSFKELQVLTLKDLV